MMCGCEPGYVCSRCRNTPRNDRYADDDPETRDEQRERIAAAPRPDDAPLR